MTQTSEGHHEHAAPAAGLFDPDAASHVALIDGPWSDPSVWGGALPGDGATVLIPDGISVTYDLVASPALHRIWVDGRLAWDTGAPTELHVETLFTGHGAILQIGTAAEPVRPDAPATIVFADGALDLAEDPGQISHGLVAFGRVDIHGTEKTGFAAADGAIEQGATEIALSDLPGDWRIGDTVLVVGTGFHGTDEAGALITEDELRVITGIEDGAIRLDAPLDHAHAPPETIEAETFVANLTRSITFTSENSEGTRGHVMLHSATPDPETGDANVIAHAAFVDLGRTDHGRVIDAENIEGRYPVHLHKIGTGLDAAPSQIVGNAVSGSPGWGIVQHESRAMVIDNVVHDITGAGIVSEWGNETGLWAGNLVSSVLGSDVEHGLGNEGAAYENQSRAIVQIANIAANSKIGWNYNGRESFPQDDLSQGAPRDGVHRQQFERAQLPFDPSPFDVVLDHEEPPLVAFDDNIAIATIEGLRVFHRQFSDDTDTMSVMRNFLIWGGRDAVNLDNYASNYQFMDSTWQGAGIGFRIERKTSAAVFTDIEFVDFGEAYRSYGLNHEVVLIDPVFRNVEIEFELRDLMRNVRDDALRAELIDFFRDSHGIDYENPMPLIVSRTDLTPVARVTFTPDPDADLSIGGGDPYLDITGTIIDSVGARDFNEYVVAKTQSGNFNSKDFEGVSLRFAGRETDRQTEFTMEQFLELHGTYQKPDGTWVVPVVNWITDRLTGRHHAVIIEITLTGFQDDVLRPYALDAWPDPGIDNPGFDFAFGSAFWPFHLWPSGQIESLGAPDQFDWREDLPELAPEEDEALLLRPLGNHPAPLPQPAAAGPDLDTFLIPDPATVPTDPEF